LKVVTIRMEHPFRIHGGIHKHRRDRDPVTGRSFRLLYAEFT